MHLHRKKQNAMNTREIIQNLMLLDRKKAKLNEYLRNYRASNASPQKKAKRNEYQRNYRASNASLKFLVTKFHDMVSQGPV